MNKGYWVARVDVSDDGQYKKYVAANAEAFAKYEGRFLVRGGTYTAVEGTPRGRNVVIEFPSYQAALDCWNSSEYQTAKAIRDDVSIADSIVIEGYDGPQPAAK